ncbi:hypothetical protein VI817_002622 [Penicillium citrinum]|nr:hypothetical protein VI817_002622 [Penicillium citrinum]
MAENLNVETFTEYGIGTFFLLVRLVARLYMGGFRGLRLDDAFSVLAMVQLPQWNIHQWWLTIQL